MPQVDTLVHAAWIAPVEPSGALLCEHSLAMCDGRIEALLPRDEARRRYRAQEEIERPHHLLIPGLVNAHTHAPMVLFRGLADDLPLHRWLQEHIWPAEQAFVSDAFVRDGMRLAAAEMLRGGTTCFSDMYFFSDEIGRVAREVGLRAVVGLIVADFPTVWARDTQEYLDRAVEVHDLFRDDPLVRTAFAPHAPYTVGDAGLERVRVLADELDVPVHMHVHETAAEVSEALARDGVRPLERLRRLGLLSPRLVAVHMASIDESEIELAAAHGIHIVHCPESNLKLASGTCPVARALERGASVALGTDGAASNNDLDMLGEMRTAALLAKLAAGRADALPAATALELATIGGARALGLEGEIGSLVPGKAADVVAVDLDRPETQPVYDPVSQLVYACSREQVTDVWVAGRALLRDRELLSVDLAPVLGLARQWQARVLAREGR